MHYFIVATTRTMRAKRGEGVKKKKRLYYSGWLDGHRLHYLPPTKFFPAPELEMSLIITLKS